MELYPHITYCVSEHQCLVPGHIGSVGMIMRILTMIVIFSLPVALSKLFESVISGTLVSTKLKLMKFN